MTDSHRYQSGSTTMTQDRDSGNAPPSGDDVRYIRTSPSPREEIADRGGVVIGVAGSIVSSDLQPIQRSGARQLAARADPTLADKPPVRPCADNGGPSQLEHAY